MTAPRQLTARFAGAIAGACGATAIARQWRRRRGDHRVFIVTYHDVSSDGDEPEGTISAQRLRRHLRHLKRHLRPASLSEALARLADPEALEEDLLCVTFDDGYAGTYDAWRILREEGVPATVFLTTGFLDGGELWFDVAGRCLDAARRAPHRVLEPLRNDLRRLLGQWPLSSPTPQLIERLKYLQAETRNALLDRLRDACAPLPPAARPLRWEQVREMLAGGAEIGCHTVSHPILSSLPQNEQAREIHGARDRIAAETGRVPVLFAYPNGAAQDFDNATTRVLRAAGFVGACTMIRGSNRCACNPLLLQRIGVGAEPCSLLAARLAGLVDWARRRWPAEGPRLRLDGSMPAASRRTLAGSVQRKDVS